MACDQETGFGSRPGESAGRAPWAALMAFALALFTIMALVLSGASSAHADDNPGGDSPVAGRTFRVATDTTFAPFEFRDSSGQMVGIDMDLMREIAKREGFDVEIQSLGFNAALQALSSNQVDAVIAGMSITDQRRQVYDFTDPYFQSGVQMAVAKSNEDVHSYDDLRGKTVVVKTGSEGEAYAKSIQEQYGFKLDGVDQSATMYEKVKSGNAVAVIDDYPVLAYGIAQNNGLKTVTDKVPGGDYAVAVNKGMNTEFVDAFNRGLASIRQDGEYQRIIDHYLADPEANAAGQGGLLQLAKQAFPALMLGLRNTVIITLISFVVAMVLGFGFGLMRVGTSRVLDWIAKIYVGIFRGTPLLVWAFFFYFGVPQLIGHPVNIWIAGVLTLALNSGAYITEIIRGAVGSVDPGQLEAARSLGLGYGKSMQRVVMPQAVKIATPSLINQLVIMVKDSSLLLAIGFGELLYQGQQIYAANFRVTETLLLVAIIYLVAITLLTWLANVIDRRINR
ncbi:amino acid ABC transporter substrate-binding protein/permease [Pseudoclavibacter sp. CFCC 13796]|uniref:amino acid ABC transporter substrate-binding protein/permease n=1 Tax=Pseudoclavibacter sp. CFCC 13796 TaxID=2615179 RepID=UPI001CE46826|nr:amino acid ABC transporter substrate-binding protein/permease [Pseudoclavibacter sp. CFCC 13796]